MKLVRVLVLGVLAIALVVGLVVAQAAVVTRLTLLSGDFVVDQMHREGAFALLYARATDAIDDPELELSLEDQAAARAALRSLMEQRVLEDVVEEAAAQFRAVIRGDIPMIAVDIRELKRDLIGEFAVAGASQEARIRLEAALADVPDRITALEEGWVEDAPPWVRRGVGNAPLALLSVVAALVLALCAVGGLRTGLGISGVAMLTTGGALFGAMTRFHTTVAVSAYRLISLDQLQLDSATTGQLHSALVGLISRIVGQFRLVSGVTAALGLCLIIAASVWRPAYRSGSTSSATSTRT